MAGDDDPARVNDLAPERIVQEEADAEADIAWTLPQLVREIGDRRVVRVGAVVIERGHDVAARSQRLGEPGVIKAVAAAPVREHDERTLRAVEYRLGGLVKIEVGEERHDEASGGAVTKRGGVEHGQRQMPATVLRVGEFELLHA